MHVPHCLSPSQVALKGMVRTDPKLTIPKYNNVWTMCISVFRFVLVLQTWLPIGWQHIGLQLEQWIYPHLLANCASQDWCKINIRMCRYRYVPKSVINMYVTATFESRSNLRCRKLLYTFASYTFVKQNLIQKPTHGCSFAKPLL